MRCFTHSPSTTLLMGQEFLRDWAEDELFLAERRKILRMRAGLSEKDKHKVRVGVGERPLISCSILSFAKQTKHTTGLEENNDSLVMLGEAQNRCPSSSSSSSREGNLPKETSLWHVFSILDHMLLRSIYSSLILPV